MFNFTLAKSDLNLSQGGAMRWARMAIGWLLMIVFATLASQQALATTYTETVPGGNGPIPNTYPPVGGTMFVLVGANGNLYYQFVNPSTQFQGFQLTGSPAAFRGAPTFQLGPTQSLNCGIVSCADYFGGSIVEGYSRLTVRDADACPGNFDYQDVTYEVNGITVSSLSDLPADAERTNLTGTTSLGFEDCFRNANTETTTAWFDLPGALLSDILATGGTTPFITDTDGWGGGRGDNAWFFRDGQDATGTPEVAPGIRITKTADRTEYAAVGDVINYSFFVENIGSVTLNDIVVSDSFITGTINCPSTSLNTGQTMTCTGQHSVTQANLDLDDVFVNTADVSANPTEGQLGAVSGTLTIPGPAADNAMTLTKTASDTTDVETGDTITYTYVARNTGNITMDNVSISDAHNGAGTLSAISPASVTLAPGAQQIFTATYVVAQADVDAGVDITNTATVNATPRRGTFTPVTADESVDVINPITSATFTKAASDTTNVNAGDTVTYTYTFTNTGNVSINNVSVTDSHSGVNALGAITPATIATVAPGQTVTFTAPYTVAQGDIDAATDITNTATASATPAQGVLPTLTDTENVDVADANPALTMTKTASVTTDVQAGDTLTYSYVVTNSGNVSMTAVSVSDAHNGAGTLSPITPASVDLDPGQSQTFTATYVVQQADIDAASDITNTATAAATPATGTYTPVTADEAVDVVNGTPSMTFTKTASDTTDVQAGDTVTYSYVATNNGNITFTGVSVSDSHSGVNALSAITPASVDLAPGQSQTFTATYVVSQADIDAAIDITNTATLTATPASGGYSPLTADETVDIEDAAPAATLSKTASDTTDVNAGDVITYTYVLTNSGNITLNNASISDVHSGAGTLSAITPASVATLAPGASQTFTATYTVTQDDVDAAVDITNTATLAATPEAGTLAPITADETVDVADANPSVNFSKTASDTTDVQAGDVITYTYVATNNGNVTVNAVSVSDVHSGTGTLSAISPASVASLPAGQSAVFTATYTVTQADIDAAVDITNTATLAATPATGTLPALTADETVDVDDALPSVTFLKTADMGTNVGTGQTVTYSYVVTNTGNVTIDNVSVSDVHGGLGTLSAITPASVAVLNPGDDATFTATYVITQDDIDRGSNIDNTATLAATPRTGTLPVTESSESVDLVDPAPQLSLAKTASLTSDVYAGQVITYSYDVKNTGNVTIMGVSISDTHSGTGALSAITPASVDLAPGDAQMFTATYTVTQADVDAAVDITNTATASGTPDSGVLTEPQAIERVSVEAPMPGAALTKIADQTSNVQVGDVITYTYEVANTGNVTWTDVSISDVHSGSGSLSAITPATVATLDPADSVTFTATYTVTQADIDAGTDITNTATLNATPAAGTTPPITATEIVDLDDVMPDFMVTKSASDTVNVAAGDVITYTYTFENTGNVTLSNVSVSDVHSGSGPLSAITPANVASLPIGQTATFTATYTVTQADIDAAADITNTATFNADAPAGPLAPMTADETVDVADAAPEITFSKVASDTTNAQVGDEITYTYEAVNTGNVSLTNVSVSDTHNGSGALSAISPASVATLAIGDTATFTATYTMTQADIDSGAPVTNTAEVTATPAAGTLAPTTDDAAVSPETGAPAMTFAKTATVTDFTAVGDVLSYEYLVTNTGNITLNSIVVTDDKIAVVNCPVTTLAPAATVTCTADYTVTQADLDAGSVTNNASATADSPAGAPAAQTDQATVDGTQTPSMTVAKTALGTTFAAVGDTLDYEYLVTNTGNVEISAIDVSDDKIATVNCPVTVLAPTETTTCTATYAVTQADIDAGSVTNIATVEGTPAGGTLTPPTDTATVNGDQMPELAIAKTALTTDFAVVNDVITYEYEVTNTGNVTITDPISVDDDKINVPQVVSCPALPAGGLAPTQSLTCTASYMVTQADLDAGEVTNIASATDGTVTSPTDTATVTGTQSPALTLDKAAVDTSFTAVGDDVNYTYTVVNTGNVLVSNLVVSDDLIPTILCNVSGVGNNDPNLDPGETVMCTGVYEVTQADLDSGSVTNNATLTADPAGGTLVPPTDSETVNADQMPALTMTKTANETAFSAVGDILTYDYVVTNTGNVLVSDLAVTDDKIASVVCDVTTAGNNDANLDPTESVTCTASYTVTQADLDAGEVTNIASATGTPSGGTLASADATETVDADQTPAMDVVKTATNVNFEEPGDITTYEYVVTNTGNVTLTDQITVDDNLVTVTCPAMPAGGVAPGATFTCMSSYTVTQADLDNGSVTNLATAMSGPVTSAQTSETIPADQSPALTIAKRAITADFDAAGDVLTYEFDVTNSGNLTLTGGIDVIDDKIGTIACVTGNLIPGDTQSCTATYTVTQADVDAGSVTNQAFGQNGTLTSPVVDATIDGTFAPSLTFDKRAVDTTMAAVGDVLTYEYDVENTGNVTISNITVSDDKIATVNCPVTTLAPAAMTTCSASYTVTQADLDAGSVTNNASVDGTPAGGTLTPETDSETVTADQMPSLSFDKRAIDTTFVTAGDVLDYEYDVTNTGNVTITGVSVSDDLIATINCPKTTLDPTESMTCQGSYTVTQADVDSGSVTNNASADGTPAGGTLTPEADDVTVDGAQTPSLSLSKIPSAAEFAAPGETITYDYIVENTGNVTINGLTVSDDKIASVTCPTATLLPGATTTCTASYVTTQADVDAGFVTNNAEVDGTPVGGTLTPTPAIATVPATQAPELSVVKTASTTDFNAPGDTVSYSYVVTNEGNTTITDNISVADDKIATVSCPALPAGGLAPGDSLTCTAVYVVTQADIDAGEVTNIASATDGNIVSPDATETVTGTQSPSMAVVKTANEADFAAVGDVLTYDYVVTNDGNVTLTSAISINDDKIPSVSCPLLPAGGLVPGASLTCTASYSVTQADLDAGSVTNVASATDGTTTSPNVTENVDADQTPALSVAKSAQTASYANVGDSVVYDYVVTNTGNVTLTSAVTVSDDKIPSVSCPAIPASGLAPNASLTCTATYVVTQADIDAGSVTNIASASSGPVTSPTDTETVNADQAPALSVTKIARQSDFDSVGDIITYDYLVRNTGNVSFTGNISVSDDRISSVSCPALPMSGLAPGQDITCMATYLITQSDLDDGLVTNVASATGTPTGGAPVTSPTDAATVTADQAPELSVVKTAAESTYRNVGDVLTYSYLVTNSGNITITDMISVADDKITTVNCPAIPSGGLVPGASLTCDATYNVTQADIDAGAVVNIATATDGTTTSDPVTERVVATRLEGLEIVKTATNVNFTLPGDIVTYEYVVTNTGNVTVTNPISVDDNRISNVTCPALPTGGLLPTDSITCSANYIVTQDDLDVGVVTNVASATDGNVTSALTSETVPGNVNPAIEMRKSSTDTVFAMVGDVLSYSYEIENTGNVTLTSRVEIIDDKIGRFTCYSGNFIPGQIETCTADYAVTQADIDRGFVTNDAYAENPRASSPPDFVTINADRMPMLGLVKTARVTDYSAVGDVIAYEYAVTNTGNTTITFPIMVSDDKIASVSCPALPAEGLAPTQSITCVADYTVTQADLDAGFVTNNASATDGFVTPATDSETVNATQTPSLAINKVAQSSDFAAVGDILSYSYFVTNDGNVTITAPLTVSDDKITSVVCPALPSGGLLPNAVLECTADYAVTQADLDAGTVTNIASASDGTIVSPTDTATITGTQTPALTTVKTALETEFSVAGDILTYEYVVTNAGNVTITNAITVSDDKIASVSCPALPAGGLAPTATLTCSAAYEVTQADVDAGSVTNIASSSDGTTTSPDVTERVTAAQAPELSVAKTALTNTFDSVGDQIDYRFVVTNSGNVTITNAVSVNDDRIGVVSCPALPAGGLLPGASVTCEASDLVTQADLNAGQVVNTATATDGTVTSAPVTETVNGAQTAAMTVAKIATVSEFSAVGDILSYNYVVTNSGNVTLTNPISVSDDKIASVNCPALPSGGLVPNDTITCSADYAVTQADIDAGSVTNIASATDGTTTSPDTSVTVDAAQAPAMSVVKTSDATSFALAGEIITYSYVVTNTGNTTITNAVSVSDDKIAFVNCPALPADGLAPNETLTCSAPYEVTQADVDAGEVTNIASATDGTTTSPDVSVTVTADQAAGLSIAKSAVDTSFAAAGDTVSYAYVVTNTGNVTITDAITVSDDKIATVNCPALPSGGLLPNATLTCLADYEVTQADIDAGSVTNIATATDGTTMSAPDEVTVDAGRDPMLYVTKEVTDLIQVGGPIYDIEYTLVMENTGNVTLTNLSLVDDLASVLAPATIVQTPSVTVSGFGGTGTANGSYNGAGAIELLSGNTQLTVGETGTIIIRVRIDISVSGPSQPNTAIGNAPQLSGAVPSNDPSVTPGASDDVNPTPLVLIDSDGDGVLDDSESPATDPTGNSIPSTDRDGDGIPDNEDYDPTGYFYCEETGDIMPGGGILISGPNGVNSSVGSLNDITIVQDGSDGFFQFYVTAPGRYVLTPTYPATGVPSTDRPVQNVALDVTSLAPANPAVLGSSEFGATGRLADFSRAANDPYYFEFDIQAGDPSVLMNNIPMKFCGEPSLTASKTSSGAPVLQDDGRHLVSYTLTASNGGTTEVQNITLNDDLGTVFGTAGVEIVSLELTDAPTNFAAQINAGYNGTTTINTLTSGGILRAGESVTVDLRAFVNPQETRDYVNVATVSGEGPLDGAALTATDVAPVTISAISDASRLSVTKTAQPRTVQIGDPVLYTIAVRNETGSNMGNLRITDQLPAGFTYIPGSSTLTTATDTIDLEPTVQGRGVLTWDVSATNAAPFNGLRGGEQINVNLGVMAGPNVTFGAHENRAFVESTTNGSRSDVATAIVDYFPEPTFDCTPIIGRVYDDVNHNGYPDDGEPGLPAVRIVTVNGDIITTDEHGRYHVPCAIIADNERGSNVLLKTDIRTLPLGYATTSENPRVMRATRGKFIKMNFGAAFMPKMRVDLYADDFQTGRLKPTAKARVGAQLGQSATAERAVLIYHANEGETAVMGQAKLDDVRQYVLSRTGKQYSDIAMNVVWGQIAAYDESDPEGRGHIYDTVDETPRMVSLPNVRREDGGRLYGDRDHDNGRTVNTGQRGDALTDGYNDDTHAALPGRAESGEYESRRPSRLARWIGWTDSSSSYAEGMEIETSVDGLDTVKRLNGEAFIGSDYVSGQRSVVAFTDWNYGAFIDRAEIRVFDAKASTRTTPVMVIPVVGRKAVAPVGAMSGKYKYVLRVYDAEGSFDETLPKSIDIGDAEYDLSSLEIEKRSYNNFGADTLSMDNIRVRGAAVRVYGRNVPGAQVEVFGRTVRVDEEGRFVAESLLPAGRQSIDIYVPSIDGDKARIARSVEVKNTDTFFVGLVDVTMGQRQSADANGDRDYTDGRAAFYVRSKLNDRYSITATADTGEGDIEDIFSDLDQKDVRSLMRRLDPDRYYPVYGDDSTIEQDAPTSGKFYARIERDDDYALWGNYRLSFNDTEYGRVNRTLYGAKLRWDSNGNPTVLGDDRSVLEAFVAEGGSRAARDELRGTGGSVYYLRNGDLNIGGEVVRVEIRDEVSGLVLETRRLVYGTDYDIDYIQGRILLNRPLASTGSSSRLFRDGGQSGNAQMLVVDYEYTPIISEDDGAVYGARGSHWLTDNVKLGATYNHDSDGNTDSDLIGADVTLQFTPGTYAKFEAAQSEGRGVTTFRSNDGGFSYDRRTTLGNGGKAMGYAVELGANLAELGLNDNGTAYAYWRQREAGFAGYGEGSDTDITQFGGGLTVDLSERLSLNGRADVSDDLTLGTNSFAELSAEYDWNDMYGLTGGISYNDDGRGNSGSALGLRLNAKLSEDTNAYIFGQTTISGNNTRSTDRIGIGAETRISKKLYAGGEVSTGEDGLGATASVRYERGDGDEMYLAYELPIRSNASDTFGTMNLGARRRYTDALSVYGEERFHYNDRGLSGLTHAYGVNYAPKIGWSLGASGEFGEVEDLDRKAVSLSAGFKDERMSAGVEGEYRTDENVLTGDERNTWLLRATAQYRPNDELSLQGKFNKAFSDASNDNLGLRGFNEAAFTEGSIAAAYRPIWDDRFNMLAKYVYLEDLSPSAQRFGGETLNYKQRSEIVSVDASYDISQKWTLGGKYGYRTGELTTSRGSNDFAKSEAELYVARLDWHVVNDWDATVEWRYLDIGNGVSTREGGLAGLFYHLGDNAKIGGGVTWGGIEEQYLAVREEEMGWFINVVGKF